MPWRRLTSVGFAPPSHRLAPTFHRCLHLEVTLPSSPLRIWGYNGADAANGTFDYSVTATDAYTQTNAIVGIADNLDGTYTITFVGKPEGQYCVVASSDPMAPETSWVPLAGSTNTVTHPAGLWSYTVTNTAA
jgi:hypothetical protein